ncbi:multidrug transporter subunit MdtD [Comamonas endophytica]|uniref:Multidrug transporter subunit MdtD n=1 Tax=Comamonas endophytica TaxID=2949090 RepID=A0ABY6GEU2_9BURK|nr:MULTISPECIES: multidrug transporter subunit MdtD [unclassified Acidovorax]MCD2512811.1 multidrug transporter subunit MdtD [Acidovorax sp. D4N7]UYG52840.1 multidrug transporter subunit MdtD [Acidovorax sp. 5MLIR]
MTFVRSNSVLLWLVALGFFMQTLDATIVNTALPAMAQALGESPLRMQSVIVAYSLTMALVIPASGWVADRFGTRRVYLTAIALFVLGSLLCAIAASLNQLVLARIVQGCGGALLLPVGRLAVLRAFPRDQFLKAMSFVTLPGLLGPLIGPTLGGWMVEYASWHWIFLVNVPVGLVGLAATLRYMRDAEPIPSRRFDAVGYALLAFAMVAVSMALEGLALLGVAGAMALLGAGAGSLLVYWRHARRRPDPLFAPALFAVRSLRIGLLGNLFSRLGGSCIPFLIPLVLQVCLGYSPMEAGMMMLPTVLASMTVKRVASALIGRWGYRRTLVGNTLLLSLMIASFALVTPEQPQWLRILQLLIFGATNSMQFTAMNTVTLKDLEAHHASSGTSLLSMVQMLAMGLGVAIAGAVLAGFHALWGQARPEAVLHAFQATFACMGLLTLFSATIFSRLERGS